MKKNEITSNIANVADLTIQIRTGALTVADAKKSARAEADRLVNLYKDDFAGLCQCLTTEFASLDSVGYFGNGDAKTGSGQSVAAMVKQQTGKWYHRSFAALDNGLVLSGTTPFMVKEKVVKAKKSLDERLEELVALCGGDEQAIAACKVAVKGAIERSEKARVASDKTAKALKVAKDEKLAAITAEKRGLLKKSLIAGMTAEELQELADQARKAQSNS